MSKHNNLKVFLVLVCSIPMLFANQTLLAQGQMENKKTKNGKRKNKESKDKIEQLDYDYELMTSIGFNYDTGSLNKTGEDPENFNTQTAYVNLNTGILFGDHFEPIIEVAFSQTTSTIGDYKETKNNLFWGVGALFNIPTGDKPDKGDLDLNAPIFANSDWIPYGGFIFSGTNHAQSGGNETTTTIAENGLRTKLIFGTRYMVLPHIALNLGVRLSYEQSASEVTEPNKTGGTLDKLSIQSNLLSFTIIF